MDQSDTQKMLLSNFIGDPLEDDLVENMNRYTAVRNYLENYSQLTLTTEQNLHLKEAYQNVWDAPLLGNLVEIPKLRNFQQKVMTFLNEHLDNLDLARAAAQKLFEEEKVVAINISDKLEQAYQDILNEDIFGDLLQTNVFKNKKNLKPGALMFLNQYLENPGLARTIVAQVFGGKRTKKLTPVGVFDDLEKAYQDHFDYELLGDVATVRGMKKTSKGAGIVS